MKKILKTPFLIAFLATSFILTSCSGDAIESIPGQEGSEEMEMEIPVEVSYEIIVNPTNAGTDERTVEITAEPNSLVSVDVNFTGDKTMRRIYMTRNSFSSNEGPQPYEYPLGEKKADGSIDLDGDDKTSFVFTFDFDAPETIDDTVQYVIWTTNARGDFRDISNSNAIADDAFGVITITAGVGAEEINFTSFTQTLLEVPLADGNSETFMSLFNGDTYLINEGEETSALWDIGYLHGTSSGAGLYSAYEFPTAGFGGKSVEEVSGVSQDLLNRCYFGTSTLTAAEFDAIVSGDALENSLTTSSDERIRGLVVGQVVEVLDQYGNRGLIKVTDIDPGNGVNSTTGKPHSITFDVKIQINAVPVAL